MALEDLIALVGAYDTPREGGRGALLDGLRAHGGDDAALELARSGDAGERRLAARLMHLLRDERHAAALEPLVADPDAEVAAVARRAFGAQPRDEQWEAIARRLTAAPDPELRAAAERWLAGEP